MALTRDQILTAADLRRVPVECPEWSGTVFVRMVTALERVQLAADLAAAPREEVPFRIVALCACDEAGAALFTAADVAALGSKGYDPIERVCEAAARLNRLTPESREELAKN